MKINTVTLRVGAGQEQVIQVARGHFYLWAKNLGSVAGDLVINQSDDESTWAGHAESPLTIEPGAFDHVLIVVSPAAPYIQFAPETDMAIGLAFPADAVDVELRSRT